MANKIKIISWDYIILKINEKSFLTFCRIAVSLELYMRGSNELAIEIHGFFIRKRS